MRPEEYQISKEKFVLANENKKLKDKELVTKPISFFHDAFNRFCRNKGSIVAAIIIGILALFAIIAPICSPYTVGYSDTYFKFCLPKNPLFAETNFWDGCEEKNVNEMTFLRYYAIGVETGHNAIKNQKYSTYVTKDSRNKDVTMYKYRFDTYQQTGVIFKQITLSEYAQIQAYQDKTNIQVIYPTTELSKRPESPSDKTNANYWYQTEYKSSKTYPLNYTINADKTVSYTNIYAPTTAIDESLYNSKMRVEGDTPVYSYARLVANDTMVEVRLCYYEYYIFTHKEVLKDGISSPIFTLGTTDSGKDILTCLSSGARFSFVLAIAVAVVNMIVGAIYGAIEGYYGGKVDLILERIVEILSAVPFMIVITLMKYHMSSTPQALILFIAFFATGWMGMASTVRMQFYRFKNQEYVLASRTLGASDMRIMFRHIFPNSLGTIVTSCVFVIPGMIFSETSLSYLGIINLETGNLTSVGTLLAAGQPYLVTYPHIVLFPAIFISLLMLSFNLFGNGLRDAFNPSLRGTEE